MRIRVLLKVVSRRRIKSPAIFIAVFTIGILRGSPRLFAESVIPQIQPSGGVSRLDGSSLGLPQHGDGANDSAAEIVKLTQTGSDTAPAYSAAPGGLHDALSSPTSAANDPALQTGLPADQPWSLSNPSTIDSARVAYNYTRKPAVHSSALGVDWSVLPGVTIILLALAGGAGLIWRRR